MAGGRRIDDHAFWAGGKPKGSVLPMGAKMKEESSAMSDGHEAYYEDTTESIKKVQNQGVEKAKSHQMKPGYRH